jgi:hypothetical protein
MSVLRKKIQCIWCNTRFELDPHYRVGDHFDCPFCKEPLKIVNKVSGASTFVEKAPEDYFEDPEFSVRSRFRRGDWF